MSFSSKVKEELLGVGCDARHCMIAELTALVIFSGKIKITENENYRIILYTENRFVAKRFFRLMEEVMNTVPEISIKKNMLSKRSFYFVIVKGEVAKNLLLLTKLLDKNGMLRTDMHLVSNLIVQKSCCKRAFIRGAFLSAGSVSDPEKGYHFEIVTMNQRKAESLKEMLNHFQINSKQVKRKKHYPVYIKEGEQLSDLLGIMGATSSLLEFENVRVIKDVRNRVNRSVNLETANIKKTASAAAKQISDIEYIRDTVGLSTLTPALEELSELRLLYREASLKELGNLLARPIGKSGVNHRLHKISEYAEEIRTSKGET